MIRAPKFWEHGTKSVLPGLLSPLAALYAGIAQYRYARTRPWKVPIPVLCIGNLVVGGAGKTPVAMAAATRLAARGINAHFLTRGHGGREKGPILANPRHHTARDVGDEPLLLARLRPTWVARDRSAAARAAVAAGAEALIMDDGFQNPTLAKDVSLVVVDGTYGFGNRHTVPAGPLRESLDRGFSRADAVVVVGPVSENTAIYLPDHLPVLKARLVPGAGAKSVAVTRVVAFAGIARPAKFFTTLEDIGCIIVSRREFPDHHHFRHKEIERLIAEARAKNARLVTTAKDAVRLPAEQRLAVDVLDVSLNFDQPDQFELLLDDLIATAEVH